MKNAIIVSAVLVSALSFGYFVFNRSSADVLPANEQLSDKILTIAPGKILQKDRLGNITLLPNANFSGVLSIEDFDAAMAVENVVSGAPLALNRGLVEYKGEEVIQNLIGITNQDFLDVFQYKLAEGRFITNDDNENNIVIGQNLKNELIEKGTKSILGSVLNVRGTEFTIVGVLDTIDTGNPTADADWNKLLLVPLHQSDQIVDDIALVEEIRIVARSSKDVDQVASDVKQVLLEQRESEDFTVLTPEDVRAIDSILSR